MIRDALYLIVATIVLALLGDWLIRRAARDVKAAIPELPKVPTLGEIVAAPAQIKRGIWDYIKDTVAGVPNDASYINQDQAKAAAEGELARRRMRLPGFGTGVVRTQ